jgi:hypothetical protein
MKRVHSIWPLITIAFCLGCGDSSDTNGGPKIIEWTGKDSGYKNTTIHNPDGTVEQKSSP